MADIGARESLLDRRVTELEGRLAWIELDRNSIAGNVREACILIAKDATSIKRLAYMARRAAWMRELTDTNHDVRQVVRPLKVDGTANPADALTKYISKPIFRAYAARMYNCSEEGL